MFRIASSFDIPHMNLHYYLNLCFFTVYDLIEFANFKKVSMHKNMEVIFFCKIHQYGPILTV